jgi:Methyladenine glycosylase
MDKSSNVISRSNYTFSNQNVMYNKRRCSWIGCNNPLMIEYHDKEWGVPVHDDRMLFEFLILESAQAGLGKLF